MSGFLYPVHEGCGGPLVPVVAVIAHLEVAEDNGPPLVCGKCLQRTDGRRGDLGQATLAALAEQAMGVPSTRAPSRARRPGVTKASPSMAVREEQLELTFAAPPRRARRAR